MRNCKCKYKLTGWNMDLPGVSLDQSSEPLLPLLFFWLSSYTRA